MPRRPKFLHPIREIRESFRLTQTAFAAKVGCSPSLIQAVENGQRALSEKLALRITAFTGRSYAELRETAREKKIPATRRSHTTHNNGKSQPDQTQTRRLARNVCDWIELLFEAAVPLSDVSKSPVNSILVSLVNWLETTRTHYRLEAAIARALKERSKGLKFHWTYGALRRNPRLAKKLGVHVDDYADDAAVAATEKITGEWQWAPNGACPDHLGGVRFT